MGKYTSRVFACERALFSLLFDQTYPAHPTTGAKVLVNLGQLANPPDEVIVVAGVPADAPTRETATNRSKEETFGFRIVIESWVPGRDAIEVSERLEELSDVVQDSLRSSTTGELTNAFIDRPGAAATHPVAGVTSWTITAGRPQHWTTTEGAVGSMQFDVEFKTHI